MKKLLFFCICVATLTACDLSTPPTTQRELVDRVSNEIKSSLADASAFEFVDCSIDTVNANSPMIDPDAYPDLFAAALHMKLVKMTGDLSDKTNNDEDFEDFGAELDSVRAYMGNVMARVNALKGKGDTPAGYFLCVNYKNGSEEKEEVYYYDIQTDKVEKKSWEPQVFGQMLSLLEEFTENPELLKKD